MTLPLLPTDADPLAVMHEATQELVTKLQAVAETMQPTGSPGDTSRALYACVQPITKLCMGLDAWDRIMTAKLGDQQ